MPSGYAGLSVWSFHTASAPESDRVDSWVPARSSVFELVVFFALVCGVQYFVTGSLESFRVSPHPFWIPVVLVAVQYGTSEGILAALMATAISFVLGIPEQAPTEDFHVYLIRLAGQPAMWLFTATLLGSFRDRQKSRMNALTAELAEAVDQRDSISGHCRRLRARNRSLQRQIAKGRAWSIPAAYTTIQQLRSASGGRIWSALPRCMDMLVDAGKYSVFLLDGDALRYETSHGWGAGDSWLLQFGRGEGVFQAIVVEGRSLAGERAGDAMILGDQGDFAVPVVSPATGAVVGMLKVEEIAGREAAPDTERHLQFLAEEVAHALERSGKEAEAAVPRARTGRGRRRKNAPARAMTKGK